MNTADKVGVERESARNSLLFQILSLYLLLLAFFVLLNSISHVENARSRAVTGSLNATFAARGNPSDKTRPFTSSAGSVLADTAYLNRVGDLIRTELALAEISEVEPGRVMAVTLPADSMFLAGEAAIDPLRRPLIERVAQAMTEAGSGVRYDVDIMVSADGRDDLSVRRSAYLASVFAAAGAPPRNVAAGIEQGASGNLSLHFHVRSQSEGRVILQAGPGR